MWYELKRVGQAILTYIWAMTMVFVLFRIVPSGPVPSEFSVIDWGEPIPVAFANYFVDVLFRLDYGLSLASGEPVFDILFRELPWTLFVSLFGLLLGFSFNIFWGAAIAYKQGTRFDTFGTLFSLTGNSIPFYVAAIIALAYLAFAWKLFPTGGRYPVAMALELPVIGEVTSWENIEPGFTSGFIIGVIWHGSLMILTGFILVMSGLSMRGNSIRVMESDYIQVARLRGLSQARIAQRYVARNAVLPTYTALMIGIPGVFSSTIITEQIFNYRAVGWLTFQALQQNDYPLLMGAFLFLTGITILGILVADLTYKFIDPRAGSEAEETF